MDYKQRRCRFLLKVGNELPPDLTGCLFYCCVCAKRKTKKKKSREADKGGQPLTIVAAIRPPGGDTSLLTALSDLDTCCQNAIVSLKQRSRDANGTEHICVWKMHLDRFVFEELLLDKSSGLAGIGGTLTCRSSVFRN